MYKCNKLTTTVTTMNNDRVVSEFHTQLQYRSVVSSSRAFKQHAFSSLLRVAVTERDRDRDRIIPRPAELPRRAIGDPAPFYLSSQQPLRHLGGARQAADSDLLVRHQAKRILELLWRKAPSEGWAQAGQP